MHILTSSARRRCCLVKGSPSPWIISLISLVLCIRLGDRVCNLRGCEVRRLCLGPLPQLEDCLRAPRELG